MSWRPWRGVPKGPLTRFFLVNTRWLGVYLHRLDRPDADRECHDHPWSFVSVVLRGGYLEERRRRGGGWRAREWRGRFSVAARQYSDAHRIAGIAPGTWTLILRGRDRRTWGFYIEDATGVWCRWVHWRRFEEDRHEVHV